MVKYSKIAILTVLIPVLLSSCNEFKQVLKSTDNEMKFEVANDYYDRNDYNRALQLYDLLQNSFRNTTKGETVALNTAMCYFNMGDYDIASHYFNRFVNTYPYSRNTEKAAYLNAYCSYLQSPVMSLDQTATHEAIKKMTSFTEKYPKSDSVDRAREIIKRLNNKLEEKDFNICMLYYKMGNYMSAIASFENMLKNYPYTEHREMILFNMSKAYYDYAENSVPEKQRERYEACIERHNTLSYLFPDSKYIKELEPIANKARKKLEKIK